MIATGFRATHLRTALAFGVLGGAALLACSSATSGGGGGAPAAGVAGTEGGDGGPSANDPSNPDPGTSTGNGHQYGAITLIQTLQADGAVLPGSSTFGGSFGIGTVDDTPPLAVVDAGQGTCFVQQAALGQHPQEIQDVSAGTLSVSGGNVPISVAPTTAKLPDGGTAFGYFHSLEAGAISPGQSLTFSASGATVPAFSATIVNPQPVRLTQPTLASGGSFTALGSEDIPFAWTGGGAGDVSFAFSQDSGAQLTSVGCTFPASAGSGVIPAALLSYLSPGGAATTAPLRLFASIELSSVQQLTVDGWALTVSINDFPTPPP